MGRAWLRSQCANESQMTSERSCFPPPSSSLLAPATGNGIIWLLSRRKCHQPDFTFMYKQTRNIFQTCKPSLGINEKNGLIENVSVLDIHSANTNIEILSRQKTRIFDGQADRNGWPPPLTVSFSRIFFGVCKKIIFFNSAFIFIINLLINQGCQNWSGWSG